jgi:hypothetical protein
LPPPAVVIVVNRGTRAATLDRFIDALDDIEGVQLWDLPPLTTLRVRTTNTQYRVVIVEGLDVYIHGGTYFPNPAYACVDGASIGGSMLKIGWIAVGMPMSIDPMAAVLEASAATAGQARSSSASIATNS